MPSKPRADKWPASSRPLSVEQVAQLMGLTVRRMQQMDEDGDGAPKNADGTYNARDFGEWLRRRLTGEDHRKRLTKAQADLAELEAQEASGELARKDHMAEGYAKLLLAFRQRMISLAPTVAPQVCAPGRAAEAQAIIQKHVYDALAELATG